MSERSHSSIEITEDLSFQRRAWIMQRVAWTIMLLLTIAALLGAFGRGTLSSARVTSPGSVMSAEYERFARLYSRNTWKLERIDQIKHAVVEANGEITVVPHQR